MSDKTFVKKDFLMTPGAINKQSKSIYKNAFNDLPDSTTYWDPMGWRTGKSRNYRDELFEADKDLMKEFDEHQQKGFSISDSIQEVRKNYDTGDWSIPIAHIPDIWVVNPEITPMADMIARETTDSDTIKATRETDQPGVTYALENTSDTEGSYTYADGSYSTKSFDVIHYGVASRLEDKMILASNQIRSTESVAQQAHMNAIRQSEERQILFGTNNDSDGFNGFQDLGTNDESLDASGGGISWLTKTRELIDKVEENGADRSSIAVVTNFETHRNLRDDLQDFTRYQMNNEDEIGFGFSTMEIDGVPVMKSHAMTNQSSLTTDEPSMFAVGMDAHYMGMLQDVSVKPLAKVGPQEQFATDAMGTLVSEAPSYIQYYDES